MQRKKKILFFAEGASLAHFARPLALALTVDPKCYDVCFLAPTQYHSWLTSVPFQVGPLKTMDPKRFLENLVRGRKLYPKEIIEQYIADDRELLKSIRPDLVIGDMRLSLGISARLSSVPYATISNAYWSPFALVKTCIPELPLTHYISPRILNPLFRIVFPWLESRAKAINALRTQYDLPPLHKETHEFHDADYVLYPDVPEFVPLRYQPPNHFFIGPLPTAFSNSKPKWWSTMCQDRRPKVLVSMGSSGSLTVLHSILTALLDLPVSIILISAGREIEGIDPGILGRVHYSAPFVPFEEAAAVSRLVITHGGSSTIYPTLSVGTPVLGIPSNFDHQLSCALLKRSGAGFSIRTEFVTSQNAQTAVRALSNDSRYKNSAERWKKTMSPYKSNVLFRRFLIRVFEPKSGF